ncbi:MAG: DMT family transporter [Pseudoflavonifractor sp.]
MLLGVLSVLSAATIMGIVPSLQKQLLMDGLPTPSLLFLTNLVVSLVTLLFILLRHQSLKLTRGQALQVGIMGLAGMGLTAFLINTAYLYLPVGTATMIHFIYPTVVCIVMGTLFRAGFSKLQIAAIAVSLLGMALLAGQGGDLSPLGVFLAVASAFSYGFYMITNEKGPATALPLAVKLFYVATVGTLFFGVYAGATHSLALPGTAAGMVQLVVFSGLGTAVAFFLMMSGVQKLGASTASFLSMAEPVMSLVFGTLWFHDPVSAGMVAGSLLVLTSVCFITIDGAQKAKLQNQT